MPFKRGHTFGFKLGQSGNPGGRPKTAGLVATLRAKYGQNAEKLQAVLDEIAFDPKRDDRVRLEAVKTLMAYGWGKPQERIQVEAALATQRLITVIVPPPSQSEESPATPLRLSAPRTPEELRQLGRYSATNPSVPQAPRLIGR